MEYIQSKVKLLIPRGAWQSQHGTLFAHDITFDDGVTGSINSKGELPPYVVGDDVWYTVKSENSYGKKLKVTTNDPANSVGFSGGGGQSDETVKRIESSWAITTAIAWAALEGSALSDDDLLKGARLVLELRDKVHQS